MPRAARIVIPHLPHHVIQRGSRRQALFFCDEDRAAYTQIVGHYCDRNATRCLAWCLMDNHVHLILVPATEDGLRATIAGAHTVYAQRVNGTHGLSGHLFDGRFRSYAMDESHLFVAARYVENNPVKAGMVERAEDWPWSSARAHITGKSDGLTDVAALGEHIANWRAMLRDGLGASDTKGVDAALRSGLPQGPAKWLADLAAALGRPVYRRNPGPAPKSRVPPT